MTFFCFVLKQYCSFFNGGLGVASFISRKGFLFFLSEYIIVA